MSSFRPVCTVDVSEAFIADDAVDTALHRQLKVRVQCRRMDFESEPAWNRPIGYSHVFQLVPDVRAIS